MTHSRNARPAGVDITASIPTQRIVTHESATPRRRDRHGRFVKSTGAEPTVDRSQRDADLPDLTGTLRAVPGGLGADIVESFTFAGQHWTSADARANGTPIGLQLAMEQSGLAVSNARHRQHRHAST